MKHLPFDPDRHTIDLARRIKNLERAAGDNARPQTEEWAVFNWDAPTVPASYAALSGWPVRLGGQLVTVIMSAGTAGSGSSTFKVRVNGTQVGSTITFPASTTAPTAVYIGSSVRVAPGSLLHFEPVTVGSGLLGFTANVVLKG